MPRSGHSVLSARPQRELRLSHGVLCTRHRCLLTDRQGHLHCVFLLSVFPSETLGTSRDSLQITRQLVRYFKGHSMTHSVSLLEH